MPDELYLQGRQFFGRVESATLECPTCGVLLRFASSTGGKGHARWRTPVSWDPRVARLRCKACGQVYLVGLLLQEAPGGRSRLTPEDQIVPGRLLARYRGLVKSFWAGSRSSEGALDPQELNKVGRGDDRQRVKQKKGYTVKQTNGVMVEGAVEGAEE